VLHWVTSIDKDSNTPSNAEGSGTYAKGCRRTRHRNSTPIAIHLDALDPSQGTNGNNNDWDSSAAAAQGTLVVTKSGRIQMVPAGQEHPDGAVEGASHLRDENPGTWYHQNATGESSSNEEDWTSRAVEPSSKMAV
jgi:hypothetical protein